MPQVRRILKFFQLIGSSKSQRVVESVIVQNYQVVKNQLEEYLHHIVLLPKDAIDTDPAHHRSKLSEKF
jgi:pyruvate-formate lyase-activating enzyme